VVDEFVDIEWILGKNETVVKVDGEVRYFGSHHFYHKAFIKDIDGHSENGLLSDVSINTMFGATITIEKLSVTEFDEGSV
jgi:hypothetical protein